MAKKETKAETTPAASAAPAAPAPAESAPAAPAAAPTATPAKKKSNTACIVIAVVVLLLFVLPALGFGAFWWFVGRKVDDATKKLQNGEVNVSLGGGSVGVNTTDNQKWPSSAPSVVPKFTAGKINNSARVGDTWTITIESATLADFNAYKNTLSASGWTLGEPVEFGEFRSYGATKSGYSVNLSYTTNDGKPSILFSISKEDTSQSN